MATSSPISSSGAAPLASPDVSSISESSESSVNVDLTRELYSDSLRSETTTPSLSSEDTLPASDVSVCSTDSSVTGSGSIDTSSRDTESVTSSSVSTVINRLTNSHNVTAEPTHSRPMSRSLTGGPDARFGVSSFKTFASKQTSASSTSAMGHNSRPPGENVDISPADPEGKHDITAENSTETTNSKQVNDEKDDVTSNLEKDVEPQSQLQTEGSESEDTDSINTPTNSPRKSSHGGEGLRPPSLTVGQATQGKITTLRWKMFSLRASIHMFKKL